MPLVTTQFSKEFASIFKAWNAKDYKRCLILKLTKVTAKVHKKRHFASFGKATFFVLVSKMVETFTTMGKASEIITYFAAKVRLPTKVSSQGRPVTDASCSRKAKRIGEIIFHGKSAQTALIFIRCTCRKPRSQTAKQITPLINGPSLVTGADSQEFPPRWPVRKSQFLVIGCLTFRRQSLAENSQRN